MLFLFFVESNNMLATRSIQTTANVKDVETAAKFIGAGAATVGCAGMEKRFCISKILYIG
jgi:hypothetical protein